MKLQDRNFISIAGNLNEQEIGQEASTVGKMVEFTVLTFITLEGHGAWDAPYACCNMATLALPGRR